MALKNYGQQSNESTALEVLQTEMEQLWSEVSVDEKMTNRRLGKKFGLLQKILLGLKACAETRRG